MNKNTKIALIVGGVIALGVTVYLLVNRKKSGDSGKKEKDNRVVIFNRN